MKLDISDNVTIILVVLLAACSFIGYQFVNTQNPTDPIAQQIYTCSSLSGSNNQGKCVEKVYTLYNK